MNIDVGPRIYKIFMDDDRLHDSYLMKKSFQRLFSEFSALPFPKDKLDFCRMLRAAFSQMLSGHFFVGLNEQDVSSLNAKVDAFLMVACSFPQLRGAAINGALFDTEKDEWVALEDTVWQERSEIPFFDILQKYPEFQRSTKKLVAKTLIATRDFHRVLQKIEQTPFSDVVTPKLMKALGERLEFEFYHDGNAQRVLSLKKMPHYWPLFEQGMPAIFCAYTPAVHNYQIMDSGIWYGGTGQFDFDFDAENRFICLRFKCRHATERQNKPLWLFMTPTECLSNLYILLQHSLDVIKGAAPGAATNNSGWISLHKTYLEPILEDDVTALKKQMKAKRVNLPTWMPVQVPSLQSNVSYSNDKKSKIFFPSP